ncbi:RusA family crossover junction endodeoxyribonuclease [Pseudomonas sp. 681]|uniref:RusA family crossover junction endodeoxyribonuclease n=1 Tax=Pseudomonas fungipugnans TaxID=3024217 RepID=A0ABT6QXJ5_9PSED|nr:RusA family crossover junction endodeoxyribonuclease [Pseudomonas sp. 681]MDI2595004.1 RusA family crossover junction endodeoxyribonuclease [Pseudomonas sp. 681]
MSDLKPVSFVVPGEPQGKGRARIGKVGNFARMYTPAKTVAYEGLVALAAQDVMQGRELIDGPVLIELRIVHSVPQSKSKKWKAQALAGEIPCMKKPDTDNVLKAICDACNGVVFKDDVQATDGMFKRRWGETPGVHVRIVPLCS